MRKKKFVDADRVQKSFVGFVNFKIYCSVEAFTGDIM